MDYPANSHRERTPGDTAKPAPVKPEKVEEKKVERIVKTEVIRRKKSPGKRLKAMFINGDAKTVASSVILDILIPAAKDTMADMMSQGVEKMLFGEARSRSRRPHGGLNGYVSYNRMSQSSSPYGRPDPRRDPREVSRRSRAVHDFDEIILETRGEAEEVIDRLFDLISRYEQATVADLYELTGINGNYTDAKWGWTDMRGAGVSRVRDGYLLNLPRPEPLD